MKTKIARTLIVIAALYIALVRVTTLNAQIPGLPSLGGGGTGSDVNTLLENYVTSYAAMLEGQALIAGALGLTVEQGTLKAEAERIKANKGKDLDAAQKTDKEAQKKILESMENSSKLEPDKQKLLAEGTVAYAVGGITLAELVKQTKSVKKPGITDLAALPKFKAIMTLPAYIKIVVTVLPTYAKFLKKVGVEADPKIDQAMKAMAGPT